MSIQEAQETRKAPLDTAAQEAFAGKMVGVLNDAMLALMTSVGHQCGLFDTMAGLPPSTSAQIAEAAGLHERYVREWLGGMVVGGIVRYDARNGTYTLPPEHAACLTTAAGPDNIAGMMPYVALCGEVEQQVVRSFREGGGVPYSAYPRFQALQAQETARVYDAALVDVIVPLVPGLTERLRDGIDVLDVGTGQGHAPLVLAEAFPKSRFRGLDQSEAGIATARAEAERRGVTNVEYVLADSTTVSGEYDLITAFDVIHDLARPAETLAAIAGGAAGGRHVPDVRHRRLQQPGGEHRQPVRARTVRLLDLLLHDHVAEHRRCRARHGVGGSRRRSGCCGRRVSRRSPHRRSRATRSTCTTWRASAR
ncbi:hypothetical protein GCM10020256_35670 [Streptomyces thermocoprophilus]